jgi:hypothetical protein
VIHALVSDSVGGIAQFHITNNGESSSILTLGTHREHHPDVVVVDTIELPLTTVDALAEEHGFAGLDLLNIDLQGAELRALRGATRTLEGIRYVYTEVNREALYQDCALIDDLDRFLGDRGFDRIITEWTTAEWGDALYVRGGVPPGRRLRGELAHKTGRLKPGRR